MKDAHLTRQERFCIRWLRFVALVYLGAALLFAFFPVWFFDYLSDIGRIFFNYPGFRLSANWDPWRVMSLAFLALMTLLAFRSQQDWLNNARLVPYLILGTGLCFAGYLGLTLWASPHFFYLVAASLDGLVFLITTYAYLQAVQSRPAISPHGT